MLCRAAPHRITRRPPTHPVHVLPPNPYSTQPPHHLTLAALISCAMDSTHLPAGRWTADDVNEQLLSIQNRSIDPIQPSHHTEPPPPTYLMDTHRRSRPPASGTRASGRGYCSPRGCPPLPPRFRRRRRCCCWPCCVSACGAACLLSSVVGCPFRSFEALLLMVDTAGERPRIMPLNAASSRLPSACAYDAVDVRDVVID